ncbi:MAG TPA: hypothetical protein VIH99_08220 [Bdellovibrionota bacterium]|jgi:hypothetical protein
MQTRGFSWRLAGCGGLFFAFGMNHVAEAACGLEAATLCAAEFRTVRACGRDVKVRTFCSNRPLPPLTKAMREEAKNYSELSDDYQRDNECLSTKGGCATRQDKIGGAELPEELAKFKDMQDADEVEELRQNITPEQLDDTRDAATLIMKRGYARLNVDYHMVYSMFNDKEFNASAEGVDLVAKQIVDDELREQKRLLDILRTVRTKFTSRGDKDSRIATVTYEGIAQGQIAFLEAVSCELGRMAKINRVRQENLKSLSLSDITGTRPGSRDPIPKAKEKDRVSQLTGTGGRQPALAGAVEAPGGVPDKEEEQLDPKGIDGNETFVKDTLESFNPSGLLADSSPVLKPEFYPSFQAKALASSLEEVNGPKAPAPMEASEESIFQRVHRKYREKDQPGIFDRRQTIRVLGGRDVWERIR